MATTRSQQEQEEQRSNLPSFPDLSLPEYNVCRTSRFSSKEEHTRWLVNIIDEALKVGSEDEFDDDDNQDSDSGSSD